jgi:invasion protein IalB
MRKQGYGPYLCVIVGCGSILLAGAAAAAPPAPRYSVKPAEVAVPPGVPMGQYSRMIRPFENWTLICDENLKDRTKVCNITEVIVDEKGNTAFSWSLAATADGRPYFLLRAPATMKPDGKITVLLDGTATPNVVTLQGCNPTVCIGLLPITPAMKLVIAASQNARISYPTRQGGSVTVPAPLTGLDAALSAIN